MLHIHFSNRLELLRAALLRQLDATAPADPLAPQQVIVPSAALRRHLSLAVADAHGICADLQFGFLAKWLWQQIARVVSGIGEESPYAAARLGWRVHAAFGDAAFVSRHPRLAAYLGGADDLMRYELACQVAGLLEQYVTYRPDGCRPGATAARRRARRPRRSMKAGRPRCGSASMPSWAWHALHPAEAFIQALDQGGSTLARRAGLPQTVHVFALPDMAPLHLRLLAAAGTLDRRAAVCAQPVPGVLVRPGRPPPPALAGRARPRRGVRGRQPPAHGLGPADAGPCGSADRGRRRRRRRRCGLRAGAGAQPAGQVAERGAGVAPDRARLGARWTRTTAASSCMCAIR